ncbi:MAG TPA: HAMP domain-containing sensor histidine kinase [Actinomycetes bacterium]|nr:HAMP domain-containing sensor histidine kinase [Actinomycetes bacterium]
MTLRTRLAVALAVLAALSVVAVTSVSYAATSRRLYGEVDAGLVSSARDLAGPGARYTPELCEELYEAAARRSTPGGPLAGLLRGAIVQCVDAGGQVIAASGPPGVRIDRPGVDAGTRPGTAAAASVGSGSPAPRPWTQTFGGQPYRVVAVARPGGGEVRVGRSLAETDRVLGSVRNRSMLVGLVIIVMAAAAGVLVARRTTRPVVRLTDAAEEIAASGRLDTAVPPGGHRRDEIGRLAGAFSAMLAALTRSRDQQQRLVQDAGHELRTPLTSLRANIDTLRRYPGLDAAARSRVLADLDSELRELSGLVDELVALAVDRYDDEPEQTVALDELAERAADRTRRRSGRGVTVDAEPTAVVGKPQLLLRAVGNLLDNAVKFSPEGAPVDVTVRPGPRDPRSAGPEVEAGVGGRLEVRDHGPGIAAEDLPHIFDRFYRALDARSLPGSGLGLAIVRKVVEDGGGSVRAANDPGGGAVFTVELPSAPARSEP